MEARNRKSVHFEDFLPSIAKKFGVHGLIKELCYGFQLLRDGTKGVITFDSLRKNSAVLGLQDYRDEDIMSMIKEGDLDGDGVLNQIEFCILMLRLSPELMTSAKGLLPKAFSQDI